MKNNQKHPVSNVQRLLDIAFDGKVKICSGGQRGYFIQLSGNYGHCAPMLRTFGKMGNILREDEFIVLQGRDLICPIFPPEHPEMFPNPVPELSCWCANYAVASADSECDGIIRETVHGMSSSGAVLINWEMSRLCNFSCNYCLTQKKIYENRKNPNYIAGDGTEIKPLTFDELKEIADKIFSQFDRVKINLIGPMEPLTNKAVPGLLLYLLNYKEKIEWITLTTNLSVKKSLNDILDLGWGKKLILYGSLHILDDNFDPFSVVEIIRKALSKEVRVETHMIPTQDVRRFMNPYIRFFQHHNVDVNLNHVVEDLGAEMVYKYSYASDFYPKSYENVLAFLKDLD